MKNIAASFLISLFLIGAAAVGGYLILPELIAQGTKPMASEIEGLKEHVNDIRQFVDEEQKARDAATLPRDADISSVVDQVNHLLQRVSSLEGGTAALEDLVKTSEDRMKTSLDTTTSSFLAEITQVRDELAAAAAGAREAREARLAEISRRMERLDAYFTIESVRTHLLKAKSDLMAQNFGTATGEIRKGRELFSALATSSVWQRETVRSASDRLDRLEKEVMDDPVTGVTRIDLLWNDLGRVLRTEETDEGTRTSPESTPAVPPPGSP